MEVLEYAIWFMVGMFGMSFLIGLGTHDHNDCHCKKDRDEEYYYEE